MLLTHDVSKRGTEMNKQVIRLALTVLIFITVGFNPCKCQLADSAWPKFRHDLQNTGQSPYSGPQMPGRISKYKAEAAIVSSPAIGIDGTVYFGTYHTLNGFFAIAPYESLKWRGDSKGVIVSSPTVDVNGTIYIGAWSNLTHNFYAYNPDGSIKWQKKRGYDIKSSPSIGSDGTIYFGSADGNFYALNPDSTEKWKYKVKSKYITYSSPAIDSSGIIYIGCWDSLVYAFKPEGPPPIWIYNTEGNIESSPAIGPDGTIYIGVIGNNRGLNAINSDGTFKDIFDTHGNAFSSAAITLDKLIVVGSRDKNLYAFNPDGSKRWNFPTGDWVDSSPAIDAEGRIYFGSVDSFVYCLRPDGTLKWKYKTGGGIISSPAIGKDGQIYIGSNDGILYTFLGDHRSPLKEKTADSLNLEDDADYWGIYCEGTPEWILENVTGSSPEDTLLHCGIKGGDISYSNVHCYRNLPTNAEADSFYLSLNFWFDKTSHNNDTSIVQSLEFTMNKWQDKKRYEFALQWQNVGIGAPQWRYWDPHQPHDTLKWVSLNIHESLKGDTLHSLIMRGEITEDKKVHYLDFIIDGKKHRLDHLFCDFVSEIKDTTDRLAVAFQLDGNEHKSPYNAFVDSVCFFARIKKSSRISERIESILPEKIILAQNYPNPFNPSTTINFTLPRDDEVVLKIFNIKGELVCTLVERKLSRGNHSVIWNGQDIRGKQCPSGIYFCQLKAGDFNSMKKLMLVR